MPNAALQSLGLASEVTFIETPLSGDECIARLKPLIGVDFMPAASSKRLLGSISGRTVSVRGHQPGVRDELSSHTTFTLPEGPGPLRLELRSRLSAYAIGISIVLIVVFGAIAGVIVGPPLGWFAPLVPIVALAFLRTTAPSTSDTISYICRVLEARRVSAEAPLPSTADAPVTST